MLLWRVEHESSYREVESQVESPITWCDEGTDSSVDAFCKVGLRVELFFLVQWVMSCVSGLLCTTILLFLNSIILEFLPQDFM